MVRLYISSTRMYYVCALLHVCVNVCMYVCMFLLLVSAYVMCMH